MKTDTRNVSLQIPLAEGQLQSIFVVAQDHTPITVLAAAVG